MTTTATETTTFNLDLAVTALAHIKAFAFHHEQGSWRCRTGMCYAGWVGYAAGAKWADLTNPDDATMVIPPTVKIPEEYQPLTGAYDPRQMHSQYVAKLLLGLDVNEYADDLFGGTLDYEGIAVAVAERAHIDDDDLRHRVHERATELGLALSDEAVFDPAPLIKA